MRASLAIVFSLLLSSACLAQAKAEVKSSKKQPQPLTLEDPLEVIAPRKLSEAEEDRREAQVLFAAARKKQHAKKLEEALRLYQRADRRDPGRAATLFEIIRLGAQLKRLSVFDNYGLAAAEANPKELLLLNLMSDHYRRAGQFETAAKLYDQLLAAQPDKAKKTAQYVDVVMMSGRLHFVLGNFHRAAERFALVLHALDNAADYGIGDQERQVVLGNASRTYTWFGESFLQAGRLKEATEAFDTAYSISRDKAGEAYQLARIHTAAGRLDEARQQLEAYFKAGTDSQGAGPYTVLTEIYEKEKKSDALLGDLEKRLKDLRDDGKDDLYLAQFLGEQYVEAEKFDKAEAHFQHVVKEGEGNKKFGTTVVLARAALGGVYRKTKNAAKLLDILAIAVENAGTLPGAADLRKDKELLAALLQSAQDRKGELEFGGLLAGALLAVESKQFEAADGFFKAALEAKNDNESARQVMLTWGLSLIDAEQNGEAAKVFRRAIEDKVLPEGNPMFHDWLAMALEFDGQTEEALKVAREAVAMAKDDPRIQTRVAWVHYHAKQYDQARQGYEKFVKDFEATMRKLEAKGDAQAGRIAPQLRRARLILSNIAVYQDNLPAAEEWLEQVLDETPEDITALNDLGYLWSDQGKHLQRSLRMIRRAVAAEPNNAAYLDSLGWVLYRMGGYDEAVKAMEKAVAAEEKPDPVILDHLGDVYHKAKQPDKARQAWQRALREFDEKRDADKIKATRKKIEKLSK